ncbi:metallo-peptidase M12B Reprolysin-like family protein, partial [Vibrio parahaemolyticus V-223/04]
RTR